MVVPKCSGKLMDRLSPNADTLPGLCNGANTPVIKSPIGCIFAIHTTFARLRIMLGVS